MRGSICTLLLALCTSAIAIATSDCTGGDASSGSGAGGAGDAGTSATGTGGSGGADAGKDANDAGTDATGAGGSGGDAGDDAADSGPQCSGQMPCAGALTCCNGVCVDVQKDPANCGACGVACGAAQFCTGQACAAAVLNNVCQNPSATVSLDGFVGDNAAGAQIGAVLATQCNPSVVVQQIDQSSPLIIEQATNRPITGVGNTFIAGGGPYGQKGLAYLDSIAKTPVYVVAAPNGDLSIIGREKGALLALAMQADLTSHHDYFILYVATEPQSGTLALAAYGLMNPGTAVAGWYWHNVVAPNLATYDKAWYVYEWTDADNDAMPTAGDQYKLTASGP